LPNYPGYKKDKTNDKALVTELWKLMDEADIILGHNGDQFDIKKSNARFLAHGLTPPTPYKTVDTKKVAKKYFGFASNKLDELCRQLGIGRKKEHEGWPLWKGCYEGDMKAWKRMLAYNVQDVELLDQLYLKLRPWMDNHPNLNLIRGTTHSCPACGSFNNHRRGHYLTSTNLIQRYKCNSCGKWSKGNSEKLEHKVVVR
jgi:DNA polymerase III epsilon subunit-like protein